MGVFDMPFSDTSLVAIAGLVATLLAAVIGWCANERLQTRQREWQLEDQRRRRREEYLNQELAIIREYVDDLTTILNDAWEQWCQVEQEIEPGSKLAAYKEGLKRRRAEFEAKWSGLRGSVWPHVRALHDTELHRLVGRLYSLYWGELTYELRTDQMKAQDELFGAIQDVYKHLEKLALD